MMIPLSKYSLIFLSPLGSIVTSQNWTWSSRTRFQDNIIQFCLPTFVKLDDFKKGIIVTRRSCQSNQRSKQPKHRLDFNICESEANNLIQNQNLYNPQPCPSKLLSILWRRCTKPTRPDNVYRWSCAFYFHAFVSDHNPQSRSAS